MSDLKRKATGGYDCGVCLQQHPDSTSALACTQCDFILCPSCDEQRGDKCPHCRCAGGFKRALDALKAVDHKRRRLCQRLGKRLPPFCTAYLQPGQLLDIIKASPGLKKHVELTYHNTLQLLPALMKAQGYPEQSISAFEDVRKYSETLACEVCEKGGEEPGQPPTYFLGSTCLCTKHYTQATRFVITRLANDEAAQGVEHGEGVPEGIIGNSNACEIVLDHGVVLTLRPGQVAAERATPGEQEPFDVTLFEDDKPPYAGAVKIALATALRARGTFNASPRPQSDVYLGSPTHNPYGSPPRFAPPSPGYGN